VKICLFCTPELMVATPAVAAPNGGYRACGLGVCAGGLKWLRISCHTTPRVDSIFNDLMAA
jgi:hypothetical protein